LHRAGSHLRATLGFIGFLLAAVAAATYLHLGLPRVPDRDAFYHLGHAALYVENGPFWPEFPWVTCSVISKYGGDLWYGFHALLTPFTFIDAAHLQVKLAGAFVLSVFLMLFYLAMRRSQVCCPFLWPFVVLSFCPFLLYRLLMTRPHVISLGLACLLLSYVTSGGIWGIGIVSFGITFIHLSLFWVVPLVFAAVGLVGRFTGDRWRWDRAAAAVIGAGLGWLVRPNPMGAAKLAYTQIVEWTVANMKGIPLLIGGELITGSDTFRRYPEEFLLHFGPGIALWILAVVASIAGMGRLVGAPPERRTLLWSSLVISALAFLMAMSFSLRAADLWAVFGVTLVASSFTFVIWPSAGARTHESGRTGFRAVAGLGLLLIVLMVCRLVNEHRSNMRRAGYEPYRLQEAAQALREHAAPGEVVFHAHWDLFPELFFWNPQNRYIGGMDPVFQYKYNPELYWKAHHIYTGQAGSRTCRTAVYDPAQCEDTYTVLRRDFGASYLVLEPRRHRALHAYARRDPRFALRFEDAEAAVFQLREDEE
jgi:hypothetical protein